jgi:hypothetical protein
MTTTKPTKLQVSWTGVVQSFLRFDCLELDPDVWGFLYGDTRQEHKHEQDSEFLLKTASIQLYRVARERFFDRSGTVDPAKIPKVPGCQLLGFFCCRRNTQVQPYIREQAVYNSLKGIMQQEPLFGIFVESVKESGSIIDWETCFFTQREG